MKRVILYSIFFLSVQFLYAQTEQDETKRLNVFTNLASLSILELNVGVSKFVSKKVSLGIETSFRPAITSNSYKNGSKQLIDAFLYSFESPFSVNLLAISINNRLYILPNRKSFIDVKPYLRYQWKENTTYNSFYKGNAKMPDVYVNYQGDLSILKYGLKLHLGNVYKFNNTKIEFYYGWNFFNKRIEIEYNKINEIETQNSISLLDHNQYFFNTQLGCNLYF